MIKFDVPKSPGQRPRHLAAAADGLPARWSQKVFGNAKMYLAISDDAVFVSSAAPARGAEEALVAKCRPDRTFNWWQRTKVAGHRRVVRPRAAGSEELSAVNWPPDDVAFRDLRRFRGGSEGDGDGQPAAWLRAVSRKCLC